MALTQSRSMADRRDEPNNWKMELDLWFMAETTMSREQIAMDNDRTNAKERIKLYGTSSKTELR